MSSSLITDHAFAPRRGSWDLCARCGIAESAHERHTLEYRTDGLAYRCPYCVDRRIDPCEHGRSGAIGTDLRPLVTS